MRKERFGEIVVKFNDKGEVVKAAGKKIEVVWLSYHGVDILSQERTVEFFHVDKERVLHNLKHYIDWYKDHLKGG